MIGVFLCLDTVKFNQSEYQVEEGGRVYLYLILSRALSHSITVNLGYIFDEGSQYASSKSCIIIIIMHVHALGL